MTIETPIESTNQQPDDAQRADGPTAWRRPSLTKISLEMTLNPGSTASDGNNPGTA